VTREQRPGPLFDTARDAASHRGRLPGLCVLVVLASFVVVMPLASATLPDVLWVGGVYDGADYDALILLSSDVSRPLDLLVELRPVPPAAMFTAPLDVAIFVTVVCVDVHGRAPPRDPGSCARLPSVVGANVLKRAPPSQT
jgi:hypothetical protein